VGDDEYDFALVGYENKFEPNRARMNVSFSQGGVFCQKESF
jgi:hypothetical protein